MLLILCQAGADRYALELRHVSEVLPRARLQCPSDLPAWLAGVLVYRGTALPVMDLTQLTQGRPCPNRLSSRILILKAAWEGRERRFGLMAENVALSDVHAERAEDSSRPGGLTALGSLRLDAQGIFQLLDVDLLLNQERRELLFAAAEEGR